MSLHPIISEACLKDHMAIVGKTGSGKTSTGKLVIEQVVPAGARVCIIDPLKSDWWGMTSSADGKKAGLPFYILGGPHGHVPLHPSAGAAIGEVVGNGSLRLSILDMADFMPTHEVKNPHAKFFTEFIPSLMKHIRGVLYLVIEEAHEFAPKEMSGRGQENMSIYFSKKLATAGRSKGIRMIVLTQRVQALHNAVLGSCETIITHRLTLPADQKPVHDWLKVNTDPETTKKIASSLSSLKKGEGWVCAGEAGIIERRQFPKITTYDNTSTPEDDKATAQVIMAPVDKAQLEGLVGKAVAEAKANDPKELKRYISTLESQLDGLKLSNENLLTSRQTPHPSGLSAAQVSDIVKKEVELAVSDRDHQWRRLGTSLREIFTKMTQAAEVIRSSVIEFAASPAEPGGYQFSTDPIRGADPFNLSQFGINPGDMKPQAVTATELMIGHQYPSIIERRPFEISIEEPGAGGGKQSGRQKILLTLAQHPTGLSPARLMAASGFKMGGGWRGHMASLRRDGLMIRSSTNAKLLIATPEGLKAAGDFFSIPRGPSMVKYWLHKLGGEDNGARKVFQVLIDLYPISIAEDLLLQRAGIGRGGSQRGHFAKLRRLELMVKIGGCLAANPELFK